MKWFSLLLIGVLSFAYFQTQKLLLLTDLSTQPVDAKSNPDFMPDATDPNRSARPPVYLISYAGGGDVYFQNQYALAQSAQGRGVDFVLNYRRSLLDPKFIADNAEIMNQKKGAGYWLWKPWVILHTLENAPENAVVIYADGGCTVKASLTPLIERVQKDPVMIVEDDLDDTNRANFYIKREIFDSIDSDYQKYQSIRPLFAAFMVIRNTSESRAFIKTWLRFCQMPHLLMDKPSTKPEYSGYRSHFHDQSILNVVSVKYGQGVQRLSYNELLAKYVNWSHRRPGAVDVNTSLIPYMGYFKMRKYDRVFFNADIVKKLRSYLKKD